MGHTGESSSSVTLQPPPPPPHPSVPSTAHKGGQVSVSSDGICLTDVNQIDPAVVSVMNLGSADTRVCYKNDSRVFFLAPTFVGKLTIYESDVGYNPKVTVKNPADSVLSSFRAIMEQRVGRPVNFYSRFPQSRQLNVFMNMKKSNDKMLFPIRVDGTNRMLNVGELRSLSGQFKMILKAGKLKESGKTLMWTISCDEMSVDTSVEVTEEDNSTTMKFLHLL